MKKKNEIEYNKWLDHLKNTKERTIYSIRRMDLLIISISGAGLYIIFETIRELKGYEVNFDHENFLFVSGISFLLSISTNFISQLTGYNANNNEEAYAQIELKRIEKKKIDLEEKERINRKVENYNRATDILNMASVFLMFIGLGFLTAFNYFLF